MKHRVLYISYDGMTDALGQSQVLPYLIGLSKLGHEITILSNEKDSKFLEKRSQILEICQSNNIDWVPVKYRKSPPVLSTLFDLRSLRTKARELHKAKSFTLVHCRSYLPARVGLMMKRLYQIPFIFDMRGFWADERVEGNLWPQHKPVFKIIYKYFKKQELTFLAESSQIISLTHAGKKELTSGKFGEVLADKIQVIPCCTDLSRFNASKVTSVQINQAKEQLQINKSDKILGYVGSVGTWYLLGEMLDFFKAQKSFHENLKFVFITGEDPVLIFNEIQKRNLDTADFRIKRVDYTKVPIYLSVFDYGIFFIRPSFSKKASSPVKQGELMAMGIPVISNSGVGDSEEIILKHLAGKVVDLKPDEWNQTDLLSFESNKEQIIEGAKNTFDLQMGIENYNKIYALI